MDVAVEAPLLNAYTAAVKRGKKARVQEFDGDSWATVEVTEAPTITHVYGRNERNAHHLDVIVWVDGVKTRTHIPYRHALRIIDAQVHAGRPDPTYTVDRVGARVRNVDSAPGNSAVHRIVWWRGFKEPSYELESALVGPVLCITCRRHPCTCAVSEDAVSTDSDTDATI